MNRIYDPCMTSGYVRTKELIVELLDTLNEEDLNFIYEVVRRL